MDDDTMRDDDTLDMNDEEMDEDMDDEMEDDMKLGDEDEKDSF